MPNVIMVTNDYQVFHKSLKVVKKKQGHERNTEQLMKKISALIILVHFLFVFL